MYISRVRLRNIRGFHGGRDVDLKLTRPDGSHAGWTVLAGRNGSGKTTLLQAIALAVSGPAVARSLVPDFKMWVSTRQDQASADVNLVPDRQVDGFTPARTSEESLSVGLEWVFHPVLFGDRPEQPSLGGRGAIRRARNGPWQDNPMGWLCVAYGPFRRLAGGARDAQRLMSSRGPVARLASLFHEDASLAEGVTWLIEQRLRAFEGRPGAADLIDVALSVLADGLLPDDYQVQKVDSEGLWVARGDDLFPLQEMSDGYRAVAALVVDLIKQIHQAYGLLTTDFSGGHPAITAPGVVIIDEVDAHLHVSWQKRIGGWLKQHFPRIQFIVTSHSPYICQAADPGGLIRLPGPDEQEPPRVVDQELYQRVVFGTGDDAVLSELFGLDTPYSEQAQVLRRELVKLEPVVLAGEATDDQLRRYHDLQKLLTSSSVSRVAEAAAQLGLTTNEQA